MRRRSVAAHPEEIVRQQLIRRMVEELGYPAALMAVEKELSTLPHLALTTSLPQKRADLLCFAPKIHPNYPLYPLLLIECKRTTPNAAALEQLLGYNAFVQAPFVALASPEGIQVAPYSREALSRRWLTTLPSYGELVGLCMRSS